MNINNLVRENIKSLSPYSSARDEFKEASSDTIFMDANENPFDSGLNRYPDPKQSLVKKALSELKGMPSSQILLGNGSDEVLDLIFRVFCEPKQDAVITLPPTYGMYKVLANTNDVATVEVPLSESFQPNVNEILRAQDERTKLLLLCSPNNPTANSFEVVKVEKLIREFKGIVVIDEAYIDFSDQESWIGRLAEFPNLIVTQTLSKAYGLAGIRLGICYASLEIISILDKVKPPYNVNQLTQDVALSALKNQEKTNLEIQRIISERNKMINNLSLVKVIEKSYPSDANFLLVKVDDADKRYQELLEKGIVVRNRTKQIMCSNCLRLTIGSEQENNRLIKVLNELK
ncbi:histidinol-phosphate transaminase [Flavobacteriaceae bacterium S356]|uniref:Histidinol-phosphate aminotransferase n=1 Tax=Asprobacillus argus TaxID=3076534 RepID=A0ABU3LDE1_9FLAO|nr:histidinol-phosphate transaminase [Flavobacteriaceae bacterium S356]